MRQILSRSVLTVAAASSILAAAGGYANADSEAQGAAIGSPGVLSGNSVSAPVHVPVNACGDTVDAVAAANPAFGNTCSNQSHTHHSHAHGAGSGGGSVAHGVAKGSPGVLSGNSVDIPVHAPVNVCGNTVDAAALLNSSMGNSCANVSEGSSVNAPQPPGGTPPRHNPPGTHHPGTHPVTSPGKHAPGGGTSTVPGPRSHEAPVTAPGDEPQLAQTGISGGEIGAAGATSVALLLGGAILYRRGTRVPARIR